MIENASLQRAAAQQIDDLDGQIALLQQQKKDVYDTVKDAVSPSTNKAWKAAVKLRQKRRDTSKRDEMDEHESLVFEILSELERPEIKAKKSTGTVVATRVSPAGAEAIDPVTGEITEHTDHVPAPLTEHAGGVEASGHSATPAEPIEELPQSKTPVLDVAKADTARIDQSEPTSVAMMSVEERAMSAAPFDDDLSIPDFLKRAGNPLRPVMQANASGV